mgnify:CR=1 FL=1
MHEGAVSAELGFTGYPSVAESVMVGARPVARRLRGAAAAPAAPLGARVGRTRCRAAQAKGVRGDGRGHAAPPLPDRRGGAVARLEPEDEPAAPLGRRPRRADRGPARRHDRLRRHRSRAARAAREGGAVRGGAVRRHGPRDRVRGASTRTSSSRACCRSETLLERMSAGPRARTASSRRGSQPARQRTSSCSTRSERGGCEEDGFRSALGQLRGCSGRRCAGRCG